MYGERQMNATLDVLDARSPPYLWSIVLLRLMLRGKFVLAARVICGICLDVNDIALVWLVVCGPHPQVL